MPSDLLLVEPHLRRHIRRRSGPRWQRLLSLGKIDDTERIEQQRRREYSDHDFHSQWIRCYSSVKEASAGRLHDVPSVRSRRARHVAR